MDRCIDCGGQITTTKDYVVCSSCGIVIDRIYTPPVNHFFYERNEFRIKESTTITNIVVYANTTFIPTNDKYYRLKKIDKHAIPNKISCQIRVINFARCFHQEVPSGLIYDAFRLFKIIKNHDKTPAYILYTSCIISLASRRKIPLDIKDAIKMAKNFGYTITKYQISWCIAKNDTLRKIHVAKKAMHFVDTVTDQIESAVQARYNCTDTTKCLRFISRRLATKISNRAFNPQHAAVTCVYTALKIMDITYGHKKSLSYNDVSSRFNICSGSIQYIYAEAFKPIIQKLTPLITDSPNKMRTMFKI